MSDKPILFSAPMVRALLAGTKTQTRRVAKPGSLMVSGSRATLLNPRIRIGDRLWVRETWSHSGSGVWTIADARSGLGGGAPIYAADGPPPGAKYWPSIHMPREFSRITLTVTDVRVQRLQDISEDDAIAEGVAGSPHGNNDQWVNYPIGSSASGWTSPIDSYRTLWNAINGPGSWDANPWVAAYTFTVALGNIDQIARAA